MHILRSMRCTNLAILLREKRTPTKRDLQRIGEFSQLTRDCEDIAEYLQTGVSRRWAQRNFDEYLRLSRFYGSAFPQALERMKRAAGMLETIGAQQPLLDFGERREVAEFLGDLGERYLQDSPRYAA